MRQSWNSSLEEAVCFALWAAAVFLNKCPCVHGLLFLPVPRQMLSACYCSSVMNPKSDAQKQEGKVPLPCSKSRQRKQGMLNLQRPPSLSLTYMRCLDKALTAQRNKDSWERNEIFSSESLQCSPSYFGMCQAFLVLCPPICSSGLQRGQRSRGWGDVYWMTNLATAGWKNKLNPGMWEPARVKWENLLPRRQSQRSSPQWFQYFAASYLKKGACSLRHNSNFLPALISASSSLSPCWVLQAPALWLSQPSLWFHNVQLSPMQTGTSEALSGGNKSQDLSPMFRRDLKHLDLGFSHPCVNHAP